MTTTAALGACAILAGLGVLQIALALGAPWGRLAWGGRHDVLPARLRVGSALAPVVYLVFAVVALERADLTDLVDAELPVALATWAVAAVLTLTTVMNAASPSGAERRTMTPVAAVLAGLYLLLALAGT